MDAIQALWNSCGCKGSRLNGSGPPRLADPTHSTLLQTVYCRQGRSQVQALAEAFGNQLAVVDRSSKEDSIIIAQSDSQSYKALGVELVL
eukprot:5196729-Amphidinium_carterae.1